MEETASINLKITESAPKQEGEKKRLPTALIIVLIAVGILAVVYLAGVALFYGRYGFNTTIDGESVVRKNPEEIQEKEESKASFWSLTLTENGLVCGTVKGKDINLIYDASDIENYPVQNAWAWPARFFQHDDFELDIKASYDETLLSPVLSGFSYAHSDSGDFNAGISYDGTEFVVSDSTVDVIDPDKLTSAVNKLIQDNLLSEKSIVYNITGEDIYMSTPDSMYDACSRANEYLKAKITYCFDGGFVIDADDIAGWILFDELMNVSLDTGKIQSWIDDLYDKYDNKTVVRYITSPAGEVTEYSGGDFGYEIITDNMLEDIVSAVESGETVELYDFGCSYCEVDISRQHMWYIIDGEVKFEADVVTGSYGTRETPRGQWSILEMARNKTLRGDYHADTGTYDYETPVSYWMRVTWSGVGFHDATWQYAFGGTRYKDGYGSHGCINMSYSDAATLYGLVWLGMPVIVHD